MIQTFHTQQVALTICATIGQQIRQGVTIVCRIPLIVPPAIGDRGELALSHVALAQRHARVRHCTRHGAAASRAKFCLGSTTSIVIHMHVLLIVLFQIGALGTHAHCRAAVARAQDRGQ